MSSKKCNIVWYKKDLRTFDHHPLYTACAKSNPIAVYVLEDEWVSSKEFSTYQSIFLYDSLIELKNELTKLNIPFIFQKGDFISCLNKINKKFRIESLLSHYETGVAWTYARDIRVKEWCAENNITWNEYHQFSVVRKLKSRDTWNQKRKKIIEREAIPAPPKQIATSLSNSINSLNIDVVFEKITKNSSLDIQKGGRKHAIKLLDSFLQTRGMHYSSEMSSPNTAYDSCSRISPHLAWGTLSLTETHHAIKDARETYAFDNSLSHDAQHYWKKSLRAFESRLWWHCHFIQKLESEPSIEFKNINAGFDGMREDSFNNDYFDAWKKGETGFPIIDACMRALIKHGWINFRMRAMLISFAAYQLWLHWEKPAAHLARLFTDFEPGIHYSQVQMQSGVTGINAIRIYSPIKQAIDQDPNGNFIRKYCPELASLSDQNVLEPYSMSPIEQITSGVKIDKDYPAPIIDHASAYTSARNTIFKWKNLEKTKLLAKEVYEKHGSRKNRYFPKQNRDDSPKKSSSSTGPKLNNSRQNSINF